MSDTMRTDKIHPAQLIGGSSVSHTLSHLLSIRDVSCRGDGGVVKVFILVHPHFCCSPRVPDRRHVTKRLTNGEKKDHKDEQVNSLKWVLRASVEGTYVCDGYLWHQTDQNTFRVSRQFSRQREWKPPEARVHSAWTINSAAAKRIWTYTCVRREHEFTRQLWAVQHSPCMVQQQKCGRSCAWKVMAGNRN